nr:MAG TPA: TFIIB-TERMINAL DOMAIN, TFIIB, TRANSCRIPTION INITIATION [Caudoviricetes sp.]
MITKEYKCVDAYEEPENPMEWLPCPRCGLRPLVWEFDNGRSTACGCGTDCYCH